MSETPIPSNHITSGKIATPSPLLAALNKQIEGQAYTIVQRAIGAVRQAAHDAGTAAGVDWYWESLIRAAVTTTDAKPYQDKLEACVAERLAKDAASRLLAEPAPAKRAKP